MPALAPGLDVGSGPWANVPPAVRMAILSLSEQATRSAEAQEAQAQELRSTRAELDALRRAQGVSAVAADRATEAREQCEAELRELRRWKNEHCDALALREAATRKEIKAKADRAEISQLKQTSERASRQATNAEQAAAELAQRVDRVETRHASPMMENYTRSSGLADLGGAAYGEENARPHWRHSHHADVNRGSRGDYGYDKGRGSYSEAEAPNALAALVHSVTARVSETEEALKSLTSRVESKAGKESVAAALHRKANKDDLVAAFKSAATGTALGQMQADELLSPPWHLDKDAEFGMRTSSRPPTTISSTKPPLDQLVVNAVTAQAKAVISARLPREVATQLSADAVKRAAEARELQAKEDAKREEVEAATAAQARAKAASFEAFREIIGRRLDELDSKVNAASNDTRNELEVLRDDIEAQSYDTFVASADLANHPALQAISEVFNHQLNAALTQRDEATTARESAAADEAKAAADATASLVSQVTKLAALAGEEQSKRRAAAQLARQTTRETNEALSATKEEVLRVKAALGGLSRSQEQLATAVDAALSPPSNHDATNNEDDTSRPKTSTNTTSGTQDNLSSDVKALRSQVNSLSQALNDQARQLRTTHSVLFGGPGPSPAAEGEEDGTVHATASSTNPRDDRSNNAGGSSSSSYGGGMASLGLVAQCSTLGRRLANMEASAQSSTRQPSSSSSSAVKANNLPESATYSSKTTSAAGSSSAEAVTDAVTEEVQALAAEVAKLRAATAAATADAHCALQKATSSSPLLHHHGFKSKAADASVEPEALSSCSTDAAPSAARFSSMEARLLGRVQTALSAESERMTALASQVTTLAQSIAKVERDGQGLEADLGARLDTFTRLALSRLTFEDTVRALCRQNDGRVTALEDIVRALLDQARQQQQHYPASSFAASASADSSYSKRPSPRRTPLPQSTGVHQQRTPPSSAAAAPSAPAVAEAEKPQPIANAPSPPFQDSGNEPFPSLRPMSPRKEQRQDVTAPLSPPPPQPASHRAVLPADAVPCISRPISGQVSAGPTASFKSTSMLPQGQQQQQPPNEPQQEREETRGVFSLPSSPSSSPSYRSRRDQEPHPPQSERLPPKTAIHVDEERAAAQAGSLPTSPLSPGSPKSLHTQRSSSTSSSMATSTTTNQFGGEEDREERAQGGGGEEPPLSPRAMCRFQPGDRVTWRGADADVPLGTIGVVLAVHLAQNDHHNAVSAVHSSKKKKHLKLSSSSSSHLMSSPSMWSHDVEVAFPVPNALEVAAAGLGGPVTAVFTFAAERLDPAVEAAYPGESVDNVVAASAESVHHQHAATNDEDAVAVGAAQASLSPSFRRSGERASGNGGFFSDAPMNLEDLSSSAHEMAAVVAQQGNESVNSKAGETLREDKAEESDTEKDVTQWTL